MKELTEKIIKEAIQKFYRLIQEDENARYKSWEHCYKIFGENQNKTDEKTIDNLCLHLAFYLASWGMYRGSSFLLQKDYKVHKKAIIEIQQNQYNILRNLKPDDFKNPDILILISELHSNLETIYGEIKKTVSKSKTQTEVSDTLITKILMGVFGCIPAYDRYVKYTLKEYNLGIPIFKNVARMKELLNIYNSYKTVIDEEWNKINSFGFEYPFMKILDILLWQIGFDDDIKGKLKKADKV